VYHFNFNTLRFPGVLPRLGVVYFLTTLIYLYVSQKGWKYIFGGILIGYYILICLVPLQGSYAVTPTHNIAAMIDRFFLSEKHLAKFAYTDPCGIIGTLPSVCSAMIGLYAGTILKEVNLSPNNKFGSLTVLGSLFTVAGLLFQFIFPLNKPLWSSSYVLFAGGVCIAAFAFCYWLIDIKRIKVPYWIFTVFGVNAIASYVLSEVLPKPLNFISISTANGKVSGMHIINDLVFGKVFSPQWASLVTALVFTLLVWLPMFVFYKKKVIIKI
jgi:predicted acyltransferase